MPVLLRRKNMSVYDINDLKLEGMNYIRKVVQKSCDDHEISSVATNITDFIDYLETKTESKETDK